MKQLGLAILVLYASTALAEHSASSTAAMIAASAFSYLANPDSSPIEKRVGEILLSGSFDGGTYVEMDAAFDNAFSPQVLEHIHNNGVDTKELRRRVSKGDLSGARDLLGVEDSELSEEQEVAAQSTARRIRNGILYRETLENQDYPEATEEPVQLTNRPSHLIPNITQASVGQMPVNFFQEEKPVILNERNLRSVGIRKSGMSIFRLAHHSFARWNSRK